MSESNPCKNISASLLLSTFESMADQYDSGYPVVHNPVALVNGIDSVLRAMNDDEAPKNVLLYVIEDEYDRKDPFGARYAFAITRTEDEKHPDLPSFTIRMFYNETHMMESFSTVEPSGVVWSADDLTNSMHPTRTKYYLGFTYMLCEKSPGFDEIPVPEKELTLEDFVKYQIEGDIPEELIDISEVVEEEVNIETEEVVIATGDDSDLFDSGTEGYEYDNEEEYYEDNDEQYESEALDDIEEENEESDGYEDYEEYEQDTANLFDAYEDEIADEIEEIEDDTEVILISPEEYDEEYDDLETDYEELFE